MNLTAIAFFMIVVGIPVIFGVGSDMFRRWLKHKEAMERTLATQTAEQAAQYAAQVARLEQRVQVLERIVTDRGTHLADEIDKLRDAPLN
jgi:hypothetical protein